ncbi:MAG TPA: aldehyde dehydrogenase family protein [Polyangiaceae bacterium]|jgi:succinate-semialdehyde dehydrogenase/glutarate-semialdehyde dehydrogenase|nr:aldehyde dehydrogenase family protein [Polyangiaceae bacterium]
MAIVETVQNGSSGPRRMKLASPATGTPIGEITVTTPDEVRAAVRRARAAQPGWEATGFDGRRRYMEKALKVLLARQEEFIDVIVRETGRSRMETIMMEIFPACDSLFYYGKRAKKILADKRVPLHLLRNKKMVMTYRPLGVIGIITPWNGPFILSLNPTVQALMAGNTVVLKPSEVTPFSGKLAADLFRDAGLPANVVNVVEGDGETGAALVDSGVDKISFTGSVRTGRKIGEACGRSLTPCTLELGGKDAMVVCADADIVRAASGAVFGAMMNSGQFCSSTERVYVVEAVADEFIRRVVEKVKTLKLGTTGDFDLGPIIWPNQLEIIERHVEDAVAKGAKLLTGGKRALEMGKLFYEPTVLVDVTHDMALMREETFGPILPIVRVRDENEALRLANDCVYGLAANVWTKDKDKAVRLAKRLEAGAVCVNDSAITYGVTEAPFGGRKASGVGQVNGDAGLKSYCFAQPIVIDRFGLKEEQMWYPYTAEKVKVLQKIMKWVWGTPLGRMMS